MYTLFVFRKHGYKVQTFPTLDYANRAIERYKVQSTCFGLFMYDGAGELVFSAAKPF